MVRILVASTGSVATIKLPLLVEMLKKDIKSDKVEISVILTEHSKHFVKKEELIGKKVEVYEDQDEWNAWADRGDPVLHIELAKWADVLLIAPLDANTLAKISNGICDNLLTCVARAWNIKKPLYFCPAMNTKMYYHPLTETQINLLKSWGYLEIPAIEKTLICGDTGIGAMAEINSIVDFLNSFINAK